MQILNLEAMVGIIEMPIVHLTYLHISECTLHICSGRS
jgi:hypothetical protein